MSFRHEIELQTIKSANPYLRILAAYNASQDVSDDLISLRREEQSKHAKEYIAATEDWKKHGAELETAGKGKNTDDTHPMNTSGIAMIFAGGGISAATLLALGVLGKVLIAMGAGEMTTFFGAGIGAVKIAIGTLLTVLVAVVLMVSCAIGIKNDTFHDTIDGHPWYDPAKQGAANALVAEDQQRVQAIQNRIDAINREFITTTYDTKTQGSNMIMSAIKAMQSMAWIAA